MSFTELYRTSAHMQVALWCQEDPSLNTTGPMRPTRNHRQFQHLLWATLPSGIQIYHAIFYVYTRMCIWPTLCVHTQCPLCTCVVSIFCHHCVYTQCLAVWLGGFTICEPIHCLFTFHLTLCLLLYLHVGTCTRFPPSHTCMYMYMCTCILKMMSTE